IEAWLAAGDHALEVRSPGGARETGYYQLRLTQLGPLYAPPAAADADAGAGGDVASGAAGPTAVVVSLALADGAAAAYWHEGQRLQGVATVENRGGEAVEVVLAAAASDARVEASVDGPVAVPPGARVEVPVTVALPADMRDDVPLLVQVAAEAGGTRSVAGAEVALACEAPPVSPFAPWPPPGDPLGRPTAPPAGRGATLRA